MEYSTELLKNTSSSDLKVYLDFLEKVYEDVLDGNSYLIGNNHHDTGDFLNPEEVEDEIKKERILLNHYGSCIDLIKEELNARLNKLFPL